MKNNLVKLVDSLMKQVNNAIINNSAFSSETLTEIIDNSDVEDTHKQALLNLVKKPGNLTNLNKWLYNYKYDLEQSGKAVKSNKKFRNKEANEILEADFTKYENFVYSLVSTKNYKSRVAKTGVKVKLLDIQNLFGYDSTESQKDLLQEGRLILWEGLKKFGVLPEKSKKFKKRDENFERKLAGKSTFVFGNLTRNLINLGKKASSKKFKAVVVEFDPKMMEGNSDD